MLNLEQVTNLKNVIRSVAFSIRQWQDDGIKIMKEKDAQDRLVHKLTWYQFDMLSNWNKYTWQDQWVYNQDIIDILQDMEDKQQPGDDPSGNISELLFFGRELKLVLDGLHQIFLISTEESHGFINSILDEAAVERIGQ